MKSEVAIKSLKVEKGCVNIECKYCTENKKCYLQQLIEENQKLKDYIVKQAMEKGFAKAKEDLIKKNCEMIATMVAKIDSEATNDRN